MYFFKKELNKYLPIAVILILFLIQPRVVLGKVNISVKVDGKEIVVKDNQTGAVVYKSGKSFYYGFTAPTSQSIITQGQINPNEIIVKYKNQSGVVAKSLNTVSRSAKVSQLNSKLRLALVKSGQPKEYFAILRELANNPNVEYVEPNYLARIAQVPNDPYYSRQWGPQDIHADLAWDKVASSSRAQVTIAVLDTGINPTHEDLQSVIVPGYDFINNTNNPVDGHGHGTHVAGIAAATINNGKGIAGVSGGSKIMPVKVLGDNGSGSYSAIINGIKYATDQGAKVINMSLGGPGASQAMQDAVNYAINRGVTVVAASGNNNGPVAFPGNCEGAVTVGAVDNNNQRAGFSNYGPEMDVAAPGVNILSSYKDSASGYTSMSGTSMAAPFVSGVAALVKAANPNLSAVEVSNIINHSATDLGTAGFDNYYGNGLVDAAKAVSFALNEQTANPIPVPAPIPAPSPAPLPSQNLALHKTAVASSLEGDKRTAAMAVDGNPQTRWASQAGVDPQWFYVDLGKTYQLNKVVLKWEAAYAKAYRIYLSNDGRAWDSIYSTSSGSGGINTLTISGQGRYVMVYGYGRGTSYGYSLWEFEVYGN